MFVCAAFGKSVLYMGNSDYKSRICLSLPLSRSSLPKMVIGFVTHVGYSMMMITITATKNVFEIRMIPIRGISCYKRNSKINRYACISSS
jgi:hypothetical protein